MSLIGRSETKIGAVCDSVVDNPNTSIRHRAQELETLTVPFQCILIKNLQLHVDKMQLPRNFCQQTLHNEERSKFREHNHLQQRVVDKHNC